MGICSKLVADTKVIRCTWYCTVLIKIHPDSIHNAYCLSCSFLTPNQTSICYTCNCFVWVESLRPRQQFFSHIGMFSWVEPVLSNKNEMSCSRTQHRTPGEIRIRDLAIKSPTLYQLLPN